MQLCFPGAHGVLSSLRSVSRWHWGVAQELKLVHTNKMALFRYLPTPHGVLILTEAVSTSSSTGKQWVLFPGTSFQEGKDSLFQKSRENVFLHPLTSVANLDYSDMGDGVNLQTKQSLPVGLDVQEASVGIRTVCMEGEYLKTFKLSWWKRKQNGCLWHLSLSDAWGCSL